MLLMSFIKNRSVNKNEKKEYKDEAVGPAVLHLLALPFISFPLTFLDLFSPLPIFLSLLFPF